MKRLCARAVWLVAVAACLACLGCRDGLDDTYGQRAGLGAEKSVNGTRVLGELFEKSGHRVVSWNRLSPRLRQQADCIVWFPDDFHPPSDEVRQWLEAWLEEKPGRTLVYVGRDFDAASWYWQKIEPQVPHEQRRAYQKHRRLAASCLAARRAGLPDREESPWFTIDRRPAKRSVRTLLGARGWCEGIDPSKLDVELAARLVPPEDAAVLLGSKGDVLVSLVVIGESQLIVVANGSLLLNLPLVNHEHRKLAGKLIDTVATEKSSIAFLESGPGGPKIVEDDPLTGMPTGAEIFCVWPTNWILLHLAVVGVLFCFWRFPIFGLAAAGEPARLSDFGKHLDAVAELLKQSGDEAYARQRVEQYVQRVKTID